VDFLVSLYQWLQQL
jgi:hypothetical protein